MKFQGDKLPTKSATPWRVYNNNNNNINNNKNNNNNTNTKHKRKLLSVGMVIILSLYTIRTTVNFFQRNNNYYYDLSSSSSSTTNAEQHQSPLYLMIVAHPDDEALWAGDFLIEHGPKTHVVVTNGGSNKNRVTRQAEFDAVSKRLQFHTAEYRTGKDKMKYIKELDWFLRRRIRQLVCSRPWDKIITHGPEGEYGHPIHHAVYGAVVEAVQQCCRKNANALHVFHPSAPLYKMKHVNQTSWSKNKVKALKLYKSQKNVVFSSFLGWNERIVPIAEYNYTRASATCLQKNVRSGGPNGTNYCRIHKYLEATNDDDDSERQRIAEEFHLMYDLHGEAIVKNSFRNRGYGC